MGCEDLGLETGLKLVKRDRAVTVWISEAASDSFGEGRRHYVLLEMDPISLIIDAFSYTDSLERLFQIFVENEIDHRLRYAEIRCTDAFVKSHDSLQEEKGTGLPHSNAAQNPTRTTKPCSLQLALSISC